MEEFEICYYRGHNVVSSKTKKGLILGLKSLDLSDYSIEDDLYLYLDYKDGVFYGDILLDGQDHLIRWDDFKSFDELDFDEILLITEAEEEREQARKEKEFLNKEF